MKKLHKALRIYNAYKFVMDNNPTMTANLTLTYSRNDNTYLTHVGLTDSEMTRMNEEIILKYNRNGNTN